MACTIEKFAGPGGLATFSLSDVSAGTRVEVMPDRGALVTRMRVGAEEVLYLDLETVADRTRNVRGGIPVLFPIAGKLPGDEIQVGGRAYPLKQHGFARNASWEVVSADADGTRARLICRLAASMDTLSRFPFQFQCRLGFAVEGEKLSLELGVQNASSTPMPLHCGFHPYFLVDDLMKARASVQTDATRAFDNTTGKTAPLAQPIDFTRPEVDLHLLDHHQAGTRLLRPPHPPVTLSWNGFGPMVLWTVKGKDFLCVEPWSAPAGAVARGEAPLLAPSDTRRFRFEISL